MIGDVPAEQGKMAIATSILHAALLCSVACPAAAQTIDAPAPVRNEPLPSVGVGEIIVTAQRRSERLRDVPISITALNSDTLIKSGVNSTLDIARLTPGLELPLYGGFLQPAIRGISSAGAGAGDSSNVALYVDGVYQPSQSGQLMDLPDVQQIEILKGPQGTLYGQNAAGGAIIISTRAPSFTPTGRLSASYGNLNDISLRGYVSGPLSDMLAVSFAGAYQDRDGLRRDLLRGGRGRGLSSELIRGRLLFQPGDGVSLTLGGYYTRRVDGDTYAGKPVGPGTPLGVALGGAYGLTFPIPASPEETTTNVVPQAKFTTYGINLLGKFETGIGVFSTVTAYGNVKVRNRADLDVTAVNLGDVDLQLNHRDYIQEVNFVSERFGIFSATAGLFYLNSQERYVPQIFNGYFLAFGDPLAAYPAQPAPLFTSGTVATAKKDSYAAYAELTAELTNALTVSVAGRYSRERQRTANNFYLLPEIADPRGAFTFEKFTPRATIRYRLDDRSNLYATYSQGFKSGYVDPANSVTPPVRPETVTAFEVGYKGRLLESLSLNIAAFHYAYKDLQVFLYQPPVGIYQNAASARIKGIDLDLALTVSPDMKITAGASYLDAHYTRFPNAGIYSPNPFGFGYDFAAGDVGGNRLIRTPTFSGNLAVSYGLDASLGRIDAFASAAYNSGISYDPAGFVKQGGYATVNAELSLEPRGIKGVRAVLWGKNLSNARYLSSVLETNFAYAGAYAEQRTYGVRAEFAF